MPTHEHTVTAASEGGTERSGRGNIPSPRVQPPPPPRVDTSDSLDLVTQVLRPTPKDEPCPRAASDCICLPRYQSLLSLSLSLPPPFSFLYFLSSPSPVSTYLREGEEGINIYILK